MLKNILIILSLIIFTVGCGENQTATDPSNNLGGGGGDTLSTRLPGTENIEFDSTIKPTVDTTEAGFFTGAIGSGTLTLESGISDKIIIPSDGKGEIIIYEYENGPKLEYKVQSSTGLQNNNNNNNGESTAYYYAIVNPKKHFNSSYIDRDYYDYVAFKVKIVGNDNLLYIFKSNEEHQKRKEKFFDYYSKDPKNINNGIKDGVDPSKVDFAPLFPNKDEIDITASPLKLGVIKQTPIN